MWTVLESQFWVEIDANWTNIAEESGHIPDQNSAKFVCWTYHLVNVQFANSTYVLYV